ncbi:hypothetical protein ACFQ3N_05155 [Virgibacillus byunsanensis]|uniref:Uncharacterized protein n=1 Tax=Virgibacillus byunsanensis TaxID=570945 RepID=A0ABW3LIC6_9BACI
MTNPRWSAYESGQAKVYDNEKKVEVKMWVHKFSHPDEHKEYIEKLKISSEFDMRYRGLVLFYGDDLITYKLKHRTSKRVNEFLRIFSKYLTDHLEDNCPSSWKECQPSFWEEFIFACYPHYMQISIKQRESDIFLAQLKKFVYWLDQRSGCSWYEVVEKYAEEALSELRASEQVLNNLLLYSFPHLNTKSWNPTQDMTRIENNLKTCNETINSIFEVKHLADNIVTVCDIDSTQTYQIVNFPVKKLLPGYLLDGSMGKMHDDIYWTWHFTEGIYPQKAKKYIRFID